MLVRADKKSCKIKSYYKFMNAFKWVWIVLITMGPMWVCTRTVLYSRVYQSIPIMCIRTHRLLAPWVRDTPHRVNGSRSALSPLPYLAGHTRRGALTSRHQEDYSLGSKRLQGPKRCLLTISLPSSPWTLLRLTTYCSHPWTESAPGLSLLQVNGLLRNAYHLPGSMVRSRACHGEYHHPRVSVLKELLVYKRRGL